MLLLSEMGLILARTIVGGLGTLAGPVLGAIVLVLVEEQVGEISPPLSMKIPATSEDFLSSTNHKPIPDKRKA
jgi:ABC-type branched-subunit amino acid transport system permease subunit